MVNEHKHASRVISSIVCSNTSTYRSVFRKNASLVTRVQ